MFHVDSTVIANGINYDLLHKENKSKKIKTITFVLRGNVLKGDFILLDILKYVVSHYKDLTINLLYNNKNISLPFIPENNQIVFCKKMGPFTRKEIASIMQNSDLYLDASLTEGFGLMALEAMAAGNVCIVSDSGGVHQYINDGVNGYIIKEVNNIDSYIDKLNYLLKNPNEYVKLKYEAEKTATEFDYDNIIDKYIEYFSSSFKKQGVVLSKEETSLYNEILDSRFKVSVSNPSKNLFYRACRKMPKGFRIKIKNAVEKLYQFTNER